MHALAVASGWPGARRPLIDSERHLIDGAAILRPGAPAWYTDVVKRCRKPALLASPNDIFRSAFSCSSVLRPAGTLPGGAQTLIGRDALAVRAPPWYNRNGSPLSGCPDRRKAPAEDALPATYEEALAALENVVYAEMVDFENDGDPELLVITVNREMTQGQLQDDKIHVYRLEEDGVREVCGSSNSSINPVHASGTVTYSLVERNGLLYYLIDEKSEESHEQFYGGPVPQADGTVRWGLVDRGEYSYNEYEGEFRTDTHDEHGFAEMKWVRGEMEDSAAEMQKFTDQYTLVRDLVIHQGQDVTVYAP